MGDRGRPLILFVINSVGAGGAERALDTILRAAPDRYELHLALLDREPEMRALPELDGRHVLDAGGRLGASMAGLRRLVRRLRPDLVVSLLVRANVANLLAGTGGRSVVCERMHLSSHLEGRYGGVKLAALKLLPRLLYRRAARVLAVSEGVRRDLVDGFGVPAALTRTINNPYDLEAIRRDGLEAPGIELPTGFIVAVGRLVEAKGCDDLIDAYRRADPERALVILGEGPERAALEARVREAGLAGRVLMPGFVADPFAVVARAGFMVSASHNEGFPNAIAEAMALGVPVCATDCPSGPAELLGGAAGAAGTVVEGAHGLLARDGDVAGLARGIQRLDRDEKLRARYAAAGRARMEDFRVERVAAEYWAAFDQLLAALGRR